MLAQLSAQRPLQQALFELLEQSLLAEQILRGRIALPQLVDNLVPDRLRHAVHPPTR